MSIYKRKESKYWWYSVYKRGGGYVWGSTGKEKKSEAEAVEKVVRLAHQGDTLTDRLHAMIDALAGAKRTGLPLAGVWDVYEDWMKSAGRSMAPITERKRKRVVERFAEWAKDNWPAVVNAGQVDRACAAGFASWLAKQGSGGKTRRNIIGEIGTVWEGLRRVRDDVTVNPWPLVLPGDDSERLPPFTPEQEKAVIEAADAIGKGWGLACRIARATGLRYGDVATLKWSEVDLDKGVLRLRPAKTARHGIDVIVPVCTAVRDALGALWAKQGGTSEYVLPGHAEAYPHPHKGEPGAFSVVLTKAGVTGGRHTFHSWRHTFRTRLAEAGVSDELAKRLGGWTEDKTAMRYDHDGRIDELRAAVEKGLAVNAKGDVGGGGQKQEDGQDTGVA